MPLRFKRKGLYLSSEHVNILVSQSCRHHPKSLIKQKTDRMIGNSCFFHIYLLQFFWIIKNEGFLVLAFVAIDTMLTLFRRLLIRGRL